MTVLPRSLLRGAPATLTLALALAAMLPAGAAAQPAQTAQPAQPVQPAPSEAPLAPTPQPVAEYEPVQQEELYRAGLRATAEGRLDDAVALLTRFIEKEPRHAGAVLELAITQCTLGNTADALRLFDEIYSRFDPPPGIREVIESQRATGCKRPTARPPSWLLSAGRGYDTNVNQGASSPTVHLGSGDNAGEYELDPKFLPHADSYSLISASYVQPLNTRGTLLIVQSYMRRHDTEHEQDTASLLAGLEHGWTMGRWRARATMVMGPVFLDGKTYSHQKQLQLRASPPLSLPPNWDLAFATTASRVSYTTRDDYDADTFELSSILTYRNKRDQVQLTVSGLRDDGAANRPGGNRQGWFANAHWYTLLRPGLFAEAGINHQHWQSDAVYSRGLIDQVRRQDTSVARAAVQWYFQPNLSLQLEGRLVRNHENIALFQYNSRALLLSVRWDNL